MPYQQYIGPPTIFWHELYTHQHSNEQNSGKPCTNNDMQYILTSGEGLYDHSLLFKCLIRCINIYKGLG